MEEDKGKKIFETLVLTVIVFCIGLIFGRSIAPVNDISKKVDMSLFWQVWDTLDKNYVEKDKVEDIDKVYGAIKGLVQSYNDPATIFLTPEETEEFNNLNSGKYFEGIGAELGYSDGSIIIVAPIDGSPAKEAGIRPGDLILAVDDYEVKSGDNIYDIVAKIRGESGTKVSLKVLHKGELEPVVLEITRGEITVPSMTLKYVGDSNDVAYIDIARFTESSLSEWESKWDSVAQDVQRSGVDKVLIDLRGNPGGYFDAAVYAADDFLDTGKIISKQEDGNGNVQTFEAKSGGKLLGKKVVIIVDEGSASASEIFTGALQQNKVATVVGTKTFGKGTAQTVIDLADGSSVHVTILKWLLPDGTWLNEENPITPDVEVENSVEDFVKGFDRQYNEALLLINK
ncbi:MAG TPA: S41 family peptidase [Candidatus Dojkabacteria bacterium]|nr:S41 family peptidase [Candidatus Dojkabacteria bacterium]HQA87586.1 S41 family peptidase [Candidatus Dojkabacteria bacterium]